MKDNIKVNGAADLLQLRMLIMLLTDKLCLVVPNHAIHQAQSVCP